MTAAEIKFGFREVVVLVKEKGINEHDIKSLVFDGWQKEGRYEIDNEWHIGFTKPHPYFINVSGLLTVCGNYMVIKVPDTKYSELIDKVMYLEEFERTRCCQIDEDGTIYKAFMKKVR